jgi:YfiR/HmsC-like
MAQRTTHIARKGRKWVNTLVLILILVYHNGFAQTKDYKFQSLYIFSFAKSIEWPPVQGDEFIVAVFDNQKVFSEMKTNLANRSVGLKPITVRHFKTIDEVAPSQVLFIPISNKNNIKQIIQKVGQMPCLIITEKEGWIKEGSIINFVITDEGKMKYELNDHAATQRNLKIPSGIKTLAIAVN